MRTWLYFDSRDVSIVAGLAERLLAWLVRPKSDRECDNEVVALEIEAIHEQSRGTYGSPRVTHELHDQGRPKHGLPVAPNLLARDFTQDAPTKVWVTDVTAIYTATEWRYLAVTLGTSRLGPAARCVSPL